MYSRTYKVCFWVGFIFSFLTSIFAGFEMAFNAYALQLKDTFNFTQIEVEAVASMGCAGVSLSFLEPLLTTWFGYGFTCALVIICVPLSTGLFAVASFYSSTFHHLPWLVSIFQLIFSTADCIAFLAASSVGVELMSKKYTAIIIGLYFTGNCLGKILIGGLLDFVFYRDLSGFFFTASVLAVAVFTPCFSCLWYARKHKEQVELEPNKEMPENEDTCSSTRDIIRSPFFHIVFWPSAVFYATAGASMINISSIADSVGSERPMDAVYIIAVCILLTRVFYGLLFDAMKSELCGFVMMITCYVAMIAAMVTGMFYLTSGIINIFTILVGISMGPGMTIPISILILRFGRSHYSEFVGAFYVITCSILPVFAVLIGVFYDGNISSLSSETKCKGRQCFFWIILIFLIITVISAICQIIYVLGLSFHKCNFSFKNMLNYDHGDTRPTTLIGTQIPSD